MMGKAIAAPAIALLAVWTIIPIHYPNALNVTIREIGMTLTMATVAAVVMMAAAIMMMMAVMMTMTNPGAVLQIKEVVACYPTG